MDSHRIHGTSVALSGRSILIIGGSGTGKSTLALRLIALGAELVSDDAVDLKREGDQILTSPPNTIEGMIEARGFGILTMDYTPAARLEFVVDMSKTEVRRMPEEKTMTLLGLDIPLVFGGNNAYLGDAIFCMLKAWPSE